MSEVLRGLQHRLEAIYGLDAGPDVRQFLIDESDRHAHAVDVGTDRPTDEVVLVRESDDGVDVGVYLAADVLARLAEEDPLDSLCDERLHDLWLAIESVSHFSYLVHRAGRDRAVSLFELELQAEVDKFVSTWFLAREQGQRGIRDGLWRRLFDEARLATGLGADERERYAAASRYAGYYCAELGLFEHGDHGQELRELRDFYRLDKPAKISAIHHGRLAS